MRMPKTKKANMWIRIKTTRRKWNECSIWPDGLNIFIGQCLAVCCNDFGVRMVDALKETAYFSCFFFAFFALFCSLFSLSLSSFNTLSHFYFLLFFSLMLILFSYVHMFNGSVADMPLQDMCVVNQLWNEIKIDFIDLINLNKMCAIFYSCFCLLNVKNEKQKSNSNLV